MLEELEAIEAEVMEKLNSLIDEDEARTNALLQDIIKSDEAAMDALRNIP